MDSTNKNLINIKGLNTQGLKSNIEYITELLQQTDILFLSEHWLSNAEKSILDNLRRNTHTLYFTPAEKQPAGRPYGGNCFIIKNSVAEKISIIHEDKHILAAHIISNDRNMVIIGVYLTCYRGPTSKDEYTQQLSTIAAIIEMYVDESEIIILGDFQTFPSKIYDNLTRKCPKRNPLSPLLEHFLEENELELIDVTKGKGPLYTYEHKTLKNQSYIDHIAVLKNSGLNIKDCQIHTKCGSNISDHQAIEVNIIHSQPTLSNIIKEETPNSVPSFAWKNTDFTINYQAELQHRLETTEMDGLTADVKTEKLNSIMIESGEAAFKRTFPERRSVPYAKKWWTPQLSASKRLLSFHFNAWRDDGFSKQADNIFFNRYTLARRHFRSAVKAAQNKEIFNKFTKINSLKQTDPHKFWTKMRNLKQSTQRRPFNINNKQTDEDITREFGDHFKTLLNNPKGNATKAARPLPDDNEEVFTVEIQDVEECIKKLKRHKSKDPFGVAAEHILHALNNILVKHIKDIYNSLFQNKSTPTQFSVAILIPLVKSYRKSLKSGNNYRGISLIPILTKLLEYVILKKCPVIAESHRNQFGFKGNTSTLHAEFIIDETLQHYNKNGSTVYMCSLDAEKVFDSCNWRILFEKLYHDKHIPLPVVKVLQSMYQEGLYSVKYNGQRSYSFAASQGVFQGSILSPHLYNIYTEELLETISESSCRGTSIHGTFSGIVAYADDIILLSPTLSGLQQLLDKCMDYFNTTGISLNTGKTEFVASHTPSLTNTYISLNHHLITPQDRIKHLGFLWNFTKRNGDATLNDINVQERINKFWGVVHSLIKGGVRFCHPSSIVDLYRTLAVPTLTYGLELTHLCQTDMDKLDREGRKALKFLFNLSKHSKNHLNTIYNIKQISTTINNNKLNLLRRMMNNDLTSNIILATLNSARKHPSLVWDCYDLAEKHKFNFFDTVMNVDRQEIKPPTDAIPDDIDYLKECLKFWHVKEMRRNFKEAMEERIIRCM